jgi:proline iminopeptidase
MNSQRWSSLRWLPLVLFGLAAAACETMSPGDPGNLVPRTVAEDANLPAIEMNGSRFHVETFGNPANPVIVILHGGPGGDYRGMLRLAGRYNGYSLADDYFLVFWDQRGSGLSQRHNKDVLTIGAYVNDLNALIDRYSPGRPVFLIGHSWGGMFATRYINEFPQRVAGAVLIEPGPMEGATMERLKGDIMPSELGSEWLNDMAWHTQFFSADDHARMDFERMLGAKDAQPRYHVSSVDPPPLWRTGAAANRYITEDGQDGNGKFTYDFTTNLAAYTTPVLFIAGALSEVIGPSLQQQQVTRFPSASLEVIPDVGHELQWEKPAEALSPIRTYLAARQAAGASQ